MSRLLLLIFAAFLMPLGACSKSQEPRKTAQEADQVAATPAAESMMRIVFLGDSLTDGYGIDKELAFPSLIEKKLHEEGYPQVKIVNAGISGSTSASAMSRFKWQLSQKPDVLFLALGANDGLRGVKLSETEKNLSEVIALAQKEGVDVILAGMKLPPNYGRDYTAGFEKLYQKLSRDHKTGFVPFLLEGVGGESHLNQEDGIHPNEKGHEIMAKTVYPIIKERVIQYFQGDSG